MNSTISLRSAHLHAGHLPKSKRDALPPSQHELASPVRHAILCARQHLLAAEYADGSWLGARPCDTTTVSQLILLQLFCGQELDDRTEDLSRTILRRQLPSGGWSTSGPEVVEVVDVSTSVQAYLALKLIGTDAAEMPMRVARTAILNAGGADRCDATTRMLLAMFGQIDFDVCPATPPELFLMASRGGEIDARVLVSLLWSHRAVRSVGAPQGIQELFCIEPKKWNRNGGFAQRSLSWFERCGCVPLRKWALNRAEKQLQQWTQESHIAKAGLQEILWLTMALHAVGHADESPPMAACWNSIDERITDQADGNAMVLGTPADRRLDTAQSLRAMIASGGEPTTKRRKQAGDQIIRDGEGNEKITADPLDLAVELLALQMVRDGCPDSEALPPAMKVVDESESYFTVGIAEFDEPSNRLSVRGDQLAAVCRRLQNRDGGWARNMGCGSSDANTTSRVLQSLAAWNAELFQPALARGAVFLCQVQAANGSWDGIDSIQTTSCTVRALLASGRTTDDPAVTGAINWLSIHQQADGGWKNSGWRNGPAADGSMKLENRFDDSFDDSSATCTAAVVAALLDADQQHSDSTARGIQFLVASQDSEGSWQEIWPNVGDNNRPIDSLTPVCRAIETLSQWAVLCSTEESEPPMFLQLVGAEE